MKKKDHLRSKKTTCSFFLHHHVKVTKIQNLLFQRPKTVTVIKGEGMPIYNKGEYLVEFFNKPLNKGDLEIHFDIKFPKELSAETKQELKKYLQ